MTNPLPQTRPGPSTKGRRPTAASFLAVLTVVLLVVSLYPFLGAIAFVPAVGTGVATQRLSGVPIPRLLRWSALTTTALIIVLVVVATVAYLTTPTFDDPATAPSDDNSWGVFVLVAAYELAVIVTLVAAVRYAARVVGLARRPTPE